jgi:O-antigen ligase
MRRYAYWLMLALVFTLPWENVAELPGIGRVSRLAGLLLAATWVLAVITSGWVRAPRASHLFALLFVLWNAASLLWTYDGPATLESVWTYLQLIALMYVIWDTVDTWAGVRWTLSAYLAGCYVTVVTLLLGYAVTGAGSEMYGRVTVGSFQPNDVGLILALGVPIAAYLTGAVGHGRRRQVWNVVCVAYVPCAAFAVLVTGSRAALAAMVPGLVYVGYRLARRRLAAAVGAMVALAVLTAVTLPFVPGRVLMRLEGTDAALRAGNLNGRQYLWAEAGRLIRDHPFLGIGGGAFHTAAVGANKEAHNLVLSLFAEVGLIGLGLFVAMLVTALLPLRRVTPVLRGMWIAVFTAWMSAALLHNWENRKQTWFLIGLAVVCGALAEEGGEEVQDAPAERGEERPSHTPAGPSST